MSPYYGYSPDADYYDSVGLRPEDRDVIDMHWRSVPLAADWSSLSVVGFEDNPGTVGDFPSLNDYSKIPIFSLRAWQVLEPLIGCCAEALPIQCPFGGSFFLINVLEIVDCVDLERSEVKRYSDGRVMRVVSYAFRKDATVNRHIFKTPQESGADLIVGEAFRERVETTHLRGLTFKELQTV